MYTGFPSGRKSVSFSYRPIRSGNNLLAAARLVMEMMSGKSETQLVVGWLWKPHNYIHTFTVVTQTVFSLLPNTFQSFHTRVVGVTRPYPCPLPCSTDGGTTAPVPPWAPYTPFSCNISINIQIIKNYSCYFII